MWEKELSALLPMLGHRNWILVVDKAFPLQSSQNMIYIDTGKPLADVLEHTLKSISVAGHISSVIYTDRELGYMSDDLCPGSEKLKDRIVFAAGGDNKSIPHEDIFKKIDGAAELFKVLVLKTETLIPYSSVFIELDCGYWDGDKEARLRSLMANA